MLMQVCEPGAFDADTQTCSALQWVDVNPSLLPPLSLADGAVLGSAIVGCWAMGAIWRWVGRQVGS